MNSTPTSVPSINNNQSLISELESSLSLSMNENRVWLQSYTEKLIRRLIKDGVRQVKRGKTHVRASGKYRRRFCGVRLNSEDYRLVLDIISPLNMIGKDSFYLENQYSQVTLRYSGASILSLNSSAKAFIDNLRRPTYVEYL